MLCDYVDLQLMDLQLILSLDKSKIVAALELKCHMQGLQQPEHCHQIDMEEKECSHVHKK
jgi:hypothetical protein